MGVGTIAGAAIGGIASGATSAGVGAATASGGVGTGGAAKKARAGSAYQQQYALNQQDQARLDRTAAEQRLAQMEQYLGSEQQFQPGYLEGLSPYTARFQAPTISNASMAPRHKAKNVEKFQATIGQVQQVAGGLIDDANELMAQAEKAYAAGDTVAADALQAEAADTFAAYEAMLSGDKQAARELLGKKGVKQLKKLLKNNPGLADDLGIADAEATLPDEELMSPLGQGVGRFVQRGMELAVPGSEEWEETQSRLQDPALQQLDLQRVLGERALGTEQKEAQRALAQGGRTRGAARSMLGEQALTQRTAEAFGAQKSELALKIGVAGAAIRTQTAQFVEKFAPMMTQSAFALSRAFSTGSPFIREEFQAAIQHSYDMSSQLASAYAQALAGASADIIGDKLEAKAGGDTGKGIGAGLDAFGEMGGMEDVTTVLGGLFGPDNSGAAAGSAASGAGVLCHGAAEFFGWHTPDWFAAREWIMNGWKGLTATLFRAFYKRHSAKVAWAIRNIPGMRALWKPFFEWCRDRGNQ